MRVLVLHEASEELSTAAEWYENERVGLGGDLLAEASRALREIAASPTRWPFVPRSRVVRRFLLSRFPYIVYYDIRDEQVRVLAFGHTSRRPGYWRSRATKQDV
jgi:plasmid stabilization system protein ParE